MGKLTSKIAKSAIKISVAAAVGASVMVVPTQTAAAGECYSFWQVEWPTLGVYKEPTTASPVLDTVSSPGIITAHTGEPAPGWVHLSAPIGGFLRKAGLTYIRTFCN